VLHLRAHGAGGGTAGRTAEIGVKRAVPVERGKETKRMPDGPRAVAIWGLRPSEATEAAETVSDAAEASGRG